MKLIYTHKSICPCGFPIMNDDVPLGREYEVDVAEVCLGWVICGGCGKEIEAGLVGVLGPGKPSFMPIQLFNAQLLIVSRPSGEVKMIKINKV